MNVSRLFGRIVWKEYRAQRSVWLALLFGTVLLQSVACIRTATWAVPAGYPFAVALAMSVCFAATAVAMLFAGEREDRTDEWLAQLPIPAGWLVGAKLSAAVFAIVSFVLAALLAAGTVVLLAKLPPGEIIGEHPEFLPRAMIGTFIWGLFFSLLTWNVLKALFLTAAAEVTTTGLAGNVADSFDHRVYFGVLACVLVADVWLARRWTSGPWMIPHGPGWLPWHRRIRHSSEPGWLAGAVGSGSPAVRTAGALIWRESRSAIPFLLAWAALGVFCVDLQMRFLEPAIPTHVLFLLATPTVCGMMTCLADQRRGTFRFLTERGVSPSLLWLQKQVVWLSIAVVVVSLFVCWDALTRDRFGPDARHPFSQPETTPELLRAVVTLPEPQSTIASVRHVSVASFAWSLGLALFAVGQLASFWIRRAVLMASAAFVLGMMTIFWHVFAVAIADLPLLWTTWPLAPLLLTATWTTCGRWMREERTWRVRVIRAAWLIGTPLLLIGAGRHLRVTQVPVVTQTFNWPALAGDMYPSNPTLSQGAIAISRSARERSLGAGTSDSGETPTPVVRNVRQFSQVLADLPGTARLAPEVLVDTEWNGQVIGTEMARSCRDLAAAGDLDAAWADVVAGLRVSEFHSRGVNWADWANSLSTREILYGAARDWAADPEQTPDRLRQALGDLEEFSVDQWSSATMLMNRYVLYRQLLVQEGPLWERLQREGQIDLGRLPLTESVLKWSAWTGERERLLRLLWLLTVRSLHRPDPEVYAATPAGTVPINPAIPPDAEIVRWLATTPSGVGDFDVDLRTNDHGRSIFDQQYLQTLAAERGTMLILALQMYRKEHGTFPVQLADLTPDLVEELPRDPCTGADFGYEPAGFGAPVVPVGLRLVPAGQPLLWSAGLNRAVPAYHAGPFETPHGTVPGDSYVASPLVWQSDSVPNEIAAEGGHPDPNRVRLIILGTVPAWRASIEP